MWKLSCNSEKGRRVWMTKREGAGPRQPAETIIVNIGRPFIKKPSELWRVEIQLLLFSSNVLLLRSWILTNLENRHLAAFHVLMHCLYLIWSHYKPPTRISGKQLPTFILLWPYPPLLPFIYFYQWSPAKIIWKIIASFLEKKIYPEFN